MNEPLTLMCVHPHPDDESISCGGVLARYADEGLRVIVVTCTGGEEGENLAGIDLGEESLEVHRRRELSDALAVLAVPRHHWLGYRDSGMVGEPTNDNPDSFHAADLDEAARRLAAIVRADRPQVVVSDDANGGYGHPDHIKANRVTVRAVQLAADPAAAVEGDPWVVAKRYVHTLARGRLRMAHEAFLASGLASPFEESMSTGEDLPFGVDDSLVTTELDVTGWLDRKRAAMAAHRSQIGEDSFFLNSPPEQNGTLFGVEQFVLERGELGGGVRPETDLFAGLRPEGGDHAGR